MPAVVLFLFAALGASVLDDPGRVVGRVVDTRSGAGVAAARVTLDETLDSVTADEDGRFEFPRVSAGSHRVRAAVAGFSPSAPVALVVPVGGEVQVEIAYSLTVSTEVRGVGERHAPAIQPALGRSTLHGRDIAAAVGGLDDLGRVLQFRPGVVASQDDRNDLLVRGGGAMETQVVVDGFELPTASHFAGEGSSSGGVSLIPSDVIGQATIQTAGFGAAYGERASSLVEIELRAGETRRFGGEISAGAGGVLGLAGGRLPGPKSGVAGAGSWLVSARRSILETAFSRGNNRAVPRYADLFGHVTLPLSPSHDLRVLVMGAADSADVEAIQSTRTSTTSDDQRLAVVGVGLRSRWSRATTTSLAASVSTNEIDAFRVNGGVNDGRELSREGELRARAEIRRSLGRHAETSAGFTIRRTDVSFDLQDIAYRNEYGSYVPPLLSRWHDRIVEPAGFAEVSARVLPRLRVTAGLRAERPGMSRVWYGTPRLRVESDLSPRIKLASSWGLYRQAIPFIWIASSAGNGRLGPIRCALTTLGVEARGPRGVTLVAEGFVKRYEGYPVDPAEPPRVLISAGADFDNPFVGRLVGAGLVHASGADFSVSRRFGAHADLAASYSRWRVVQRGLEQQWRPADFDIRHQARVLASWRPSQKWTASTSWRYASGRPYTPFDVAASLRAGAGRYDRKQTNALNYAPYVRLDARVERVFTRGRAVLTLFAEVENATGHDNIYLYTWSRAARGPDPILQWGRTPVAGLRVEF